MQVAQDLACPQLMCYRARPIVPWRGVDFLADYVSASSNSKMLKLSEVTDLGCMARLFRISHTLLYTIIYGSGPAEVIQSGLSLLEGADHVGHDIT